MGRSITHKKQICYKVIVEGESIEQTARESDHSPGLSPAMLKIIKEFWHASAED